MRLRHMQDSDPRSGIKDLILLLGPAIQSVVGESLSEVVCGKDEIDEDRKAGLHHRLRVGRDIGMPKPLR
jgi:hypothetical protein